MGADGGILAAAMAKGLEKGTDEFVKGNDLLVKLAINEHVGAQERAANLERLRVQHGYSMDQQKDQQVHSKKLATHQKGLLQEGDTKEIKDNGEVVTSRVEGGQWNEVGRSTDSSLLAAQGKADRAPADWEVKTEKTIVDYDGMGQPIVQERTFDFNKRTREKVYHETTPPQMGSAAARAAAQEEADKRNPFGPDGMRPDAVRKAYDGLTQEEWINKRTKELMFGGTAPNSAGGQGQPQAFSASSIAASIKKASPAKQKELMEMVRQRSPQLYEEIYGQGGSRSDMMLASHSSGPKGILDEKMSTARNPSAITKDILAAKNQLADLEKSFNGIARKKEESAEYKTLADKLADLRAEFKAARD